MGQALHAVDLKALSVMIIDDCRFMRVLLRDVLGALGVTDIIEADDGADALRRMADADAPAEPDLILCDYLMRPMNGLDFVRHVRTSLDSPNPYVTIIMVSGYTDLDLVAQARDAGVNDFLAKPISARTLYAHIADCALMPRVYVRSMDYFGPDRRRRDMVCAEARRRDDVGAQSLATA